MRKPRADPAADCAIGRRCARYQGRPSGWHFIVEGSWNGLRIRRNLLI